MVIAGHKFSSHGIGVLLLLLSVTCSSMTGLITKGVSASSWDVVFWRGVFSTLFTIAYIALTSSFRREFLQLGPGGWMGAIIGASCMLAFISAFKLTTVANIYLIFAASPLLSALIAWVWINERPTKAVIIGCILSFVGVLVIVGGSVGSIHLLGDLLALWMTIGLSILLVVYRRYPDTPSAGPTVVSSLILMPVGLFFGAPFAVSGRDMGWLVVFGLLSSIVFVSMVAGSKRVPAGEASLINTLETPLAPLLVWLFMGEVPGLATLAGGALVLAGSALTQILRSGKMQPAE
jgi:drug/metabolite transporter (DMT)-like permease